VSISLTPRGKKLMAILLLSLGFGLLFLDPYVLAVSAALAALALHDSLDARRISRRGAVSVSPPVQKASLVRGESFEFRLKASSERDFSLLTEHWLQPSSAAALFRRGENEVVLSFGPALSGVYSLESLRAMVLSRNGLFSVSVNVPFTFSGRVYPRFMLAALSAFEYMTASGGGSEGERELRIIGPGLEYADTREYSPGDSLRRLDWKATARSYSLMVKHFYREGGGSLQILHSLEAPGQRTNDQLATAFVNLVLSCAMSGLPVSAVVYLKGGERRRLAGTNAAGVLAGALDLLLEYSRLTYEDFYSIIDTLRVPAERRAAMRGHVAGWLRLVERARLSPQREETQLNQYERHGDATFVVLSSLVGSAAPLEEALRLREEAGSDVFVAHPSAPWVDAGSLEEAYVMRISFERTRAALTERGCSVVPLSLMGHALSAVAPRAVP
jgi:uncharacterized protein (DUF58 family)